MKINFYRHQPNAGFRVVLLLIIYGALCLGAMGQNVVYVDLNATGNNDGTSWADAYTDLQAGINGVSGTGEAWVAAGTYKPTTGTDRNAAFLFRDGVSIYGGFNGTETALNQRDPETNQTILSGDIGTLGSNTDNSYHILVGFATGIDRSEILDGFIIEGANGSFSSNGGWGGAIYLNGASPTITNCVFRDNVSSGNARGGGLFASGSSAPLIKNCTFYSNVAPLGGGLSVDLNNSVTVEVQGCLFYENNSNSGGGGGAIYAGASGIIDIRNTTIADNSSPNIGGGIWNQGNVTLYNSIVWGNTAPTNGQMTHTNSTLNDVSIQGGNGNGTNIHNIDPDFVDSANDDYRISPCSPLIDLGNSANVPGTFTSDLLGNSRIKSMAVDLGAYEEQLPIGISALETIHVECNGASTGQISVQGSGGSGPLQYSIDGINFGTNTIFSNLPAAMYTLTILDPTGCEFTTDVEITQPMALSLDSADPSHVTCVGDSNGSINVSVSGGTAPYTYSLDGLSFQSNSVLDNLATGTYMVTVRDANNCEVVMTGVEVNDTPAFRITSINNQDALCNGDLVSQQAITQNGQSPFEISIDGGNFIPVTPFSNNFLFQVTGNGMHSVTIKDGTGCLATENFTISEPTLLEATETIVDVSCNSGADGNISIGASGGTTPYTYRLTMPDMTVVSQSTNSFPDLAAGSYPVEVSDANGCRVNMTLAIDQPDPLTLTIESTDILCNGELGTIDGLVAGGGVGSYVYNFPGINTSFLSAAEWVTAGVLDAKAFQAGQHSVIVRDANGCETTETVTFSEPQIISFTVEGSVDGCSGSATASFEIMNPAGGTGTLEYSINQVDYQSGTTFGSLQTETTYSFTARDENGCEVTVTGSIADPTELTAQASVTLDEISVSASGGSGTYEYGIGGTFQSSSVLTVTENGTYNVTVRDGNNCEITLTVLVDTVLGIESNSDLSLYPNPTSDYLHFDFEKPVNYEISNLAGQTVKRGEAYRTVNVSQLETGVYLMTAVIDGVKFAGRFVINR